MIVVLRIVQCTCVLSGFSCDFCPYILMTAGFLAVLIRPSKHASFVLCMILDVTKLPAYQEVPENCPTWKRALIEKKNKQLEEDAMVNIVDVTFIIYKLL